MKKEYMFGIIGLLGGALIAILFARSAVNTNNAGMMKMMGMRMNTQKMEVKTPMNEHKNHGEGMEASMDDMTGSLAGLKGNELDEAFLREMIVHHQGAIDMAKMVKENGAHEELRVMADEIISAQSSEITQMQAWLKEWGFE